jgi:hypothetical protein
MLRHVAAGIFFNKTFFVSEKGYGNNVNIYISPIKVSITPIHRLFFGFVAEQ